MLRFDSLDVNYCMVQPVELEPKGNFLNSDEKLLFRDNWAQVVLQVAGQIYCASGTNVTSEAQLYNYGS